MTYHQPKPQTSPISAYMYGVYHKTLPSLPIFMECTRELSHLYLYLWVYHRPLPFLPMCRGSTRELSHLGPYLWSVPETSPISTFIYECTRELSHLYPYLWVYHRTLPSLSLFMSVPQTSPISTHIYECTIELSHLYQCYLQSVPHMPALLDFIILICFANHIPVFQIQKSWVYFHFIKVSANLGIKHVQVAKNKSNIEEWYICWYTYTKIYLIIQKYNCTEVSAEIKWLIFI